LLKIDRANRERKETTHDFLFKKHGKKKQREKGIAYGRETSVEFLPHATRTSLFLLRTNEEQTTLLRKKDYY